MQDKIIIKNARVHNLKNISLEIPKNKIVVFTGVSGSGKSSVVFDTLYTEAQRQLIETFSTFAQRRLPKLSRPDVDEIKNLGTAIIIDQKRLGRNMRSTVGTATEVYTYLRMLFSRCGEPFIGPSHFFSFNHPEGMCPACSGLGKRIRIDIDLLIDTSKSIKEGAVTHPSFKVGNWYWKEIMRCGLFDVEKPLKDFTEEEFHRFLYEEHIEVEESKRIDMYSKKFEGIATKLERLFTTRAVDEMPDGMKDVYQSYFNYMLCDQCEGMRLNKRALRVKVEGYTISDLVTMELSDLYNVLMNIKNPVAKPMIQKMTSILFHLVEIGVGYLSLNRGVSTLSGGESQRVKMARQLDCDLTGLMYILDEPSIGLHPKDTAKLIDMLRRLRDQGNTVIVVEHDPDIISVADYIVDVGPEAGKKGGEVCFSGTYAELLESDTTTACFLNQRETMTYNRKDATGFYEIKEANLHNLRNIDVIIPRGILTCVTGVAGSGKSTLINEIFSNQEECIVIDQNPVGRSNRSNALTYTKIFDKVRKEFAKATGKSASLFSFNSDGACPDCKGQGRQKIEMNFMDDVDIVCSTCNGQRYTEEVLELTYRGCNIFEILEMTVQEASQFFEDKRIRKQLEVLCSVGLHYINLGQPLSTLSGGETQRLKLACELGKKGELYIMDEPTTGLHMADIERLMKIIRKLVANGNTVVVIEHNLDVIKQADWVIDLGPEGGANGGEVIAVGTPETIINEIESFTGTYLKELLRETAPV